MTEQEQVQLLPCPFCGYANPSMFYEWQVVCRPALDEDYPPEFGCDAEGPFGKTEAEAIAAWNTRHTATAEALEAMREAATALYLAGKWELHETDVLPHEQAVMWERLRDAIGLPKGTHTAAIAYQTGEQP
jgi:hypothetical protein